MRQSSKAQETGRGHHEAAQVRGMEPSQWDTGCRLIMGQLVPGTTCWMEGCARDGVSWGRAHISLHGTAPPKQGCYLQKIMIENQV